MIEAMDTFGNPSSLHSAGLNAEKLVRLARERVYRALSIKNPDGYRVISVEEMILENMVI